MQLSPRALNRTLLLRQHLLVRVEADPVTEVEHLIGLQAQDNLPPYLSLAARLSGFDPHALSGAIEDRRLVRFLTMRGTVHVLSAEDALTLRAWVQPKLDRVSASSAGSRAARHLSSADLVEAAGAALAGGPLPVKVLGERLRERFPDVPQPALQHVARERVPMLQVPPRGLWRRSGGVVYQLAETWLGRSRRDLDLPGLIRRYLRAYGPASAADMTAWSGVTRLGPEFTALAGELETHTDAAGTLLYDVPGAPLADEDRPAPARLLGTYDNLWLSHAAGDRVSTAEERRRWMGVNGGVGWMLLVDGHLAGQWRLVEGRVSVEPWRRLTREQRAEVDAEAARVEELFATPAY